MANKLTEFVEKHKMHDPPVKGATVLVMAPADLESLLRGLLGEIEAKKTLYMKFHDVEKQCVLLSDIRSVFSEYINLDNNG